MSSIKLGAIFVGWITSLFITFLIAAVVATGMFIFKVDVAALPQKTHQFTSISFSLAVFIGSFIIFFLGGYVAGRMAAFAGIINGAMVVVTSLIVSIFAVIFFNVIEDKLGLDLLSQVQQAISPYFTLAFISILFAFAGSIIGGKVGEGYFERLELSAEAKNQLPNLTLKARYEMLKPKIMRILFGEQPNEHTDHDSRDRQAG
ncbi:MAG: hypothetical protein AB1743_06465 [Actinomycetota bacterium]